MKIKNKIICLNLLINFGITIALPTQQPCRSRQYQDGNVCVCDEYHCDTLNVPKPTEKEYVLVSSSREGDRFFFTKKRIYVSKYAQKI